MSASVIGINLLPVLSACATASLLQLSAGAKTLDYEEFARWFEGRFISGDAFPKAVIAAESVGGAFLVALLGHPSGLIVSTALGTSVLLVYFVVRLMGAQECRCFGTVSRHTTSIMLVYGAIWFFATAPAWAGIELWTLMPRAVAAAQAAVLGAVSLGLLHLATRRNRMKDRRLRALASSRFAARMGHSDESQRVAILFVSRGCESCVSATADFEGIAMEFSDRASFVLAMLDSIDAPIRRVQHVRVVPTDLTADDTGIDIEATPTMVVGNVALSSACEYVGLDRIRTGFCEIIGFDATRPQSVP